ncbi:GATA type transcriptional activator of nitrogen-regulated proteins [Coemansia sp. IMI 209127]|nr:GATA type transcriptional activator of nitrogen-regulated proteins [Coemansia sp. IMI 209127]
MQFPPHQHAVEKASKYPPPPPPQQTIERRLSPPQIIRWKPLAQCSSDRVSIQETRLMTAAAKAAAVKAVSSAVASAVKRIGKAPKRSLAQQQQQQQQQHGSLSLSTAAATAYSPSSFSSGTNGGPPQKRGKLSASTNGADSLDGVGGEKRSKANHQHGASSTTAAATAAAAAAAATTSGAPVGPMTCVNCGTTKTPLWRRDPRNQPICNACGLYLKSYGKMRPLSLKRTHKQNDQSNAPPTCDSTASCSTTAANGEGTCPGDGTCNGKGGGPSCDGCPAYNQKHLPHTTRTANANGGGGARRLTAAERAAAIANGAATDEHGNIVGPIPESAIGPGRVPPSVAEAISASLSLPLSVKDEGSVTTGGSAGSRSPSSTTVVGLDGATLATERAVCFNCGTDYTPLWRRDAEGHIACNACGLYYKLHNKHRPISLKRSSIKRRRRGMPKQPQMQVQQSLVEGDHESGEDDDEEQGEFELQESPKLINGDLQQQLERKQNAEDDEESVTVSRSASPLVSNGLLSLVKAADLSPPLATLPTDPNEVEKRREELQRECARLQALLDKSTSLLESLNKKASSSSSPTG